MTRKSQVVRLLPLDEFRKILGDRCAGWSDTELERHVEQLEDLARWCFEEVDRRCAESPGAAERQCPLPLDRKSA